jgi:putative FmdB family regulatory protein
MAAAVNHPRPFSLPEGGKAMPIYEYECSKCGGRVEALIRNKADVPVKCVKCGGKLAKALSRFSVSAAGPAMPAHEPSAACSSCPSGACPYSGR